ncbi:HTH-type transcriptional activator IlvY [Streptomyces sp. PSKA54]|uniref:HTH-type transcriptional activator IlvY n=1 Tax=Streptomyces himalayensis subsp. aureolus TaxID=2758039 RepID=A0A7W2D2Q3_9ACTN|nr:HTH-type transcriptional activator IlvY [Streptomyces himalayensis]MBA4863618.1 HTH-type transcriptional activator IlvY [Streptomyces himalayensis subsp. aureolus]
MQNHDQYRLFLHLASTLNFTRTAADCHVSPATLSRTVQRLEAATGHRLLDRGPHGVALTEHGHHFRCYAAEALELWDRYCDNDLTRDQLGGELRVFASVTACQSLLPDLLAPLRDAHPRVQISVRTGDAAAALALLDDGEADLAVAALPSRIPATLLARTVARTPLVLVRADPPRSSAQLPAPDEPFVLPRQGLVRDIANRWFRRLGITPRIAAEADGHEALLTLVALDYGTGIIPDLVLRHCSIRHRLHVAPAPSSPGELTIGACIRRTDLHRPLVAAAWAATGPGQPLRSQH